MDRIGSYSDRFIFGSGHIWTGSYLDWVGHIVDWIGSVLLVGSAEYEAKRALDRVGLVLHRVGLKGGRSVMILAALLNVVVGSNDAMVCFQ